MINEGLFTSNSEEWATPQGFFDKLDEEFKFVLDPCATVENAKCKTFFTKNEDGLSKSWIAGGGQFSVILLTGEKFQSGSKKPLWKTKTEQRSLCYCQRELIQSGFTSLFTISTKSDLSKAGCISMTVNNQLHFRQWS